jgi:cell division transport system permease protein
MSMLRSLWRIIVFAFQNSVRNFWLSFITLTIFVLTLITVNVVLVLNVLADGAVRGVEEKVEVTIYFEAETSESLVKSAQGYLLGFPEVRDVRYLSAEEALETFERAYALDEVVLASLEEVGGNPFGDALVVSAQSPEDFAFISEAIETPEFAPFIREKNFDDFEEIIDRIKLFSERLRIAGAILIAFFALIAMLIIFNTIRVAIYVHRDEISIMKLVGANDWFVRGPFLFEAFFYTFLSTAIVIGLMTVALIPLDPWVARYFGEVDVQLSSYFWSQGLTIFGLEFLLLLLLSLLTTVFAMRKYLRT